MDYFKRVQSMTATRFWINNVTLQEAELALEAGACGCTQNPSYVWKILTSDENDSAFGLIRDFAIKGLSPDDIVLHVQRALVSGVAQKFLPLFKESAARYGYVSIQGNPFREDYDSIVDAAVFNGDIGPNIMIKIPVTEQGLLAIEHCIRLGMNINATEVMSLEQAKDLLEVYDRATKNLEKRPMVYLSHIAGIFDQYLFAQREINQINIPEDFVYQAGKIVAQKIRAYMEARNTEVGFINGGARGLHHFTEWVGGNVANTINWNGTADKLIEQNPYVVPRFNAPVDESVVDALVTRLPDFRRAYFEGALSRDEYETFGPVELFRENFCSAWSNAADEVKRVIDG